MTEIQETPSRTIRIAAAIIRNESDQMLLVRKKGTEAFMQPGGKIDPGEAPEAALIRELDEELRLDVDPGLLRYIGHFTAPAANEPDHFVEAAIFEMPLKGTPVPAAEIEEMLWVGPAFPDEITLAPLTRDEILPRYLLTNK